MIYLDTHVVVWLYAGLVDRFTQLARNLLNQHELRVSPIVRLELQYLYEIRRVTVEADDIVTDLSDRLGLTTCGRELNNVVNKAMTFSWTRDPFDRLIVAHAGLQNNLLLSKDQKILTHYPHARWS